MNVHAMLIGLPAYAPSSTTRACQRDTRRSAEVKVWGAGDKGPARQGTHA